MTFDNRMFGPYGWTYWTLIFCNGIVPQILWFKKWRTNIPCLFIVSVIVSIGMFFERFVIIITSLSRDFLPFWDYSLYAGTFGLFLTLFLLFCRFLPVIAIAEVRESVHHEAHVEEALAHSDAKH